MIVNPDKFQAIVAKKNYRMKDSYALNISNQTINSENYVKLLGIEIDNALSFNKHIPALCKKARNQLNAIGRIQKYVGFKEKEVLLSSFVLSNFKGCVRYIFAGLFLSLNDSACQTRKNVFYFTSKALLVLEKMKF